ncbi:MAG TPA: hypothetical protein VHH72_04095 [Solirubrobacterales bacterium]|jgi:hypothetical protein|nr:hypothetical protein [Solirubrobacterales bacterium]
MSRSQLSALVSGLAIVVLGALLLLQTEGTIDVESGWMLAILAGLCGAALVASGVGARER